MNETATMMRNISTTSQNSVSVTRSRYSRRVSGSIQLFIVALFSMLPAVAAAQTYTITPLRRFFSALAAVVRLSLRVSPTAVFRAVWAVHIDPVNRVSRRATPHVSEEGFKAVAPAGAHLNSAGSVIRILGVLGVVASAFRAAPRDVFARISAAMGARAARRGVAAQAPAAAAVAGAEALAGNGDMSSAGAQAFPHGLLSRAMRAWRTADNSEPSKRSSCQINWAHLVNYISACVLLVGTPTIVAGQTYTVTPTPFQTAFDNSGNTINNACIWTYLAGTTTPVDTYTTSSGTANANPIRSDSAGRFTAYLQPGVSYKFVYESACTPPSHGTTLRTADNIAAVPTSGLNVDVTGTAGETINAGDVVYLSDGSASLNAGQWYRADADNVYAAGGAILIGIAPSAISSSASGTIRVAGRVTGLSGLTVGARHFVSTTTGGLTATAPVDPRFVGSADSATTLVVAANPARGVTDPSPCEGRLTLTSGTAVTTSDVTAAGTLYFTPLEGNQCALYTGSVWVPYVFTERSLALSISSATNYDVFFYDNAGTLTLETVAWTNDTTRATAITLQDGVYVKSGSTTKRYLGTIRGSGANTTEDSLAKRFVWNYYNRRPRPLRVFEATGSWTYTTQTVRQANGATGNKVEVVIGVQEGAVQVALGAGASNTNVGVSFTAGIGVDSITAMSTEVAFNEMYSHVAGHVVRSNPLYNGFPGLGYHYFAWLETSQATGTTTWYGANTPAGFATRNGLTGFIQG